jgi:hypothetical protein
MKSGSWSSYQSALPSEARSGGEPDDDPTPGRHDHEPPHSVYVTWFREESFRVVEMLPGGIEHDTGTVERHVAPVSRWFPAESWAWKHAIAWRDAMARRHGHATIEDDF